MCSVKTAEYNLAEMKMIGKHGTRAKGNCCVDNDATLNNGRLDNFTRKVERKIVTFAHSQ